MIEVLSSFNCTTNTFFLAINIMDNYLENSKKVIETKDIHIIGCTSMLIASKMEEIIPFKVSTIVDKMTHGKIQTKEIIKCEESILKSIGFSVLDKPSIFIFIELLSVSLNLHLLNNFKEVMKIITYISKMIIHDYNLLKKYPLKYLGGSCLFITFKIIEQTDNEFQTKSLLEKMKNKLNLNEQIFYNSSESILELAKNFEKTFSFAKNLNKFDSFSLETLK